MADGRLSDRCSRGLDDSEVRLSQLTLLACADGVTFSAAVIAREGLLVFRRCVRMCIHIMIQYSRDTDGEYGLDAVLTPHGQNITDLVRIQALKYFESLLKED